MRLFLVLALVIAIAAIIFALQNAIPITVVLGVWQVEGSLALVLLLTLAVGFLIGLLVSMPTIFKRSWRVSHSKKKIGDLEKEIAQRNEKIVNQQKRIDYLEESLKSEMGSSRLNESEQ
jgi:uncharacterized integral membrane protein